MHQRPHLVDPKCNTPLPHLVDNKCIAHFGLVVMGFVFGFYITGNRDIPALFLRLQFLYAILKTHRDF